MTRLVCLNNDHPLDGMDYTLSAHALVFLDKINSSLIFRTGKDSDKYEGMLSAHRNHSFFSFFSYTYNEEKKYFIESAGIRGIEWRTYPDLISYIEETNQEEFKILDVPEGKVFTEFELEDSGNYVMIISDGPITVA
uniref:Uncharacterized protein n=1 Tax=Pithovirus LCPAC406 TaxID=2506599 RepID=A0A481ZG83_9VIRU|nr:MAG: uncharacterized protein LCPAC406_03660 [Pithovirus LCPAC406]